MVLDPSSDDAFHGMAGHGMAGHGMAVIRDPTPHPIGAGSQHSTSFYDSKR